MTNKQTARQRAKQQRMRLLILMFSFMPAFCMGQGVSVVGNNNVNGKTLVKSDFLLSKLSNTDSGIVYIGPDSIARILPLSYVKGSGGGSGSVDSITISNDSLFYWAAGISNFVGVISGGATVDLTGIRDTLYLNADTLVSHKNWLITQAGNIATAFLRLNGQSDSLLLKEPVIVAGTVNDYWQGDKTWQPKAGLPISTATQAALDGKIDYTDTIPANGIATKNYVNTAISAIPGDTIPGLQAVTLKDSATTTQIQARRFIAGTPETAVPDTFYFWGDSFTEGYALAEKDRYVNIVSKALGAVAVNLGVNGSTLEGGEPVGNMLDNYLSTIPVWHEGLYASIAYGFNDVYYNYASFTGANFKADYQTVLNEFYTKLWPTSHMFLNTPFYMSPTVYAPFAGNPAATEARHIQFVDTVISVGLGNGIAVADQYRYMAGQPNPRLYIMPDSIHINATGHLKIAELLLSTIDKPVEDNGETIVSTGTTVAKKYRFGGYNISGENFQTVVLDDSGYIVVNNTAFARDVMPDSTPQAINTNILGVAKSGTLNVNDNFTVTQGGAINKYGGSSSFPVKTFLGGDGSAELKKITLNVGAGVIVNQTGTDITITLDTPYLEARYFKNYGNSFGDDFKLGNLNWNQFIYGDGNGNFIINNGSGPGWRFRIIQNNDTFLTVNTQNRVLWGSTTDRGRGFQINKSVWAKDSVIIGNIPKRATAPDSSVGIVNGLFVAYPTDTSGGGGGSTAWGGITGTLSAQTDLQAALDAKQNTLGFTAENIANKATDFSTVNNTKYPTVEAVDNYVTAGIAALSSTYVPLTRTINGDALSSNVTLDIDDVAPTQTGNSGKVLTTNGTNATWVTPSGGGGLDLSSQILYSCKANGNTTAIQVLGSPPITISGSAVGTLASTNALTQKHRLNMNTSTSANQRNGLSSTTASMRTYMGSHFIVTNWFGIENFDAGQRIGIGLAGDSPFMSTLANPSGYAFPLIAIGKDVADATFHVLVNDASGTPTKTNTGISFSSTSLYKVQFSSTGANVDVTLTEYTAAGATNTYTLPTATTDIPAAGQELLFSGTVGNAATGVAISYTFISVEMYPDIR